MEKGLNVMLCIGEVLDDRKAGRTLDVCAKQLEARARASP